MMQEKKKALKRRKKRLAGHGSTHPFPPVGLRACKIFAWLQRKQGKGKERLEGHASTPCPLVAPRSNLNPLMLLRSLLQGQQVRRCWEWCAFQGSDMLVGWKP
jgi:hypothetical protein